MATTFPVIAAEARRMTRYYFETEKHGALWFSYIWPEDEDAETAPPVKEFHSMADDDEIVTRKAVRWILDHGKLAAQ